MTMSTQSSTENQYSYAPLQQPDSIRLLELLPGPCGTDLHCRISESSRGHTKDYEALSYTWDGERTETIFVDEASSCYRTSITENLYKALQVLRDEVDVRTLWIDAICIDQANTKERNTQVPYMGEIYSGATEVIVWLGLVRMPQTSRLKKILEELVELEDQLATNDSKLSDNGGLRFVNKWDRVNNSGLFTLPWFSRVWTVQEFILGKQVSVHFGSNKAEPGDWRKASVCVDSHMLSRAVTTWYTALTENEIIGRTVYTALAWGTLNTLSHFQRLARYRTAYQAKGQRQSPFSLAMCVSDLASGRLCSDERDRVYGMLGIAHGLTMRPDYNLSAPDIFLDFAKRSLESGDATLLHGHNIGDRTNGVSMIQSLAAFPAMERHPIYRATFAGPSFSAGGLGPSSIRVREDGKIVLKGVLVDRVTQNTSHLYCGIMRSEPGSLDANQIHYPKVDIATMPTTYIKVLEGMFTDHVDNEDRRRYASTRSSYWFRDRFTFSCSPYETERLYDVFACTMTARQDMSNRSLVYFTQVEILKLLQRSLFRTATGYLGTGTNQLLPGDEVFLFKGAKTPFLVRKVVNENPETCNYMLISDCYLHGWMDGSKFDQFSGETEITLV